MVALKEAAPGSVFKDGNMYILGGMAWEYTNKKYLDEHMKKYGKWPEKKGEWYSDDIWEIIVDNEKILIEFINIKVETI